MNDIRFRFAEKKDVPLILHFIEMLAQYEKMEDEVVATEALLNEWIFDRKKAEVLFALADGKEIGFALFFIIFPHSSAARASISKICTSFPNTAGAASEKRF